MRIVAAVSAALMATAAAAAFDPDSWLERRELLTREAERLEKLYAKCAEKADNPAEKVTKNRTPRTPVARSASEAPPRSSAAAGQSAAKRAAAKPHASPRASDVQSASQFAGTLILSSCFRSSGIC